MAKRKPRSAKKSITPSSTSDPQHSARREGDLARIPAVISPTIHDELLPVVPRLKDAERRLCRFYEPLLLLMSLGKTKTDVRSEVVPKNSNFAYWGLRDIRRRFLKELAYLCDHRTGGATVTAIALQRTPQARIFWVASNSDPAETIVPFLHALLQKLQNLPPGNNEVVGMAKTCITFSHHRIQASLRFLQQNVLRLMPDLLERIKYDHELSFLLPVMHRFLNVEKADYDICLFAFEKYHSPEALLLRGLCREPEYGMNQDSPAAGYRLIRHYIGRLGYQIKAVQTVVQLTSRLRSILDGFEVRGLTPPTRSAKPPQYENMNLVSIINRVLPKDSRSYDKYQFIVQELNTKLQIEDRFLTAYQSVNFKPAVHAEIQVLDHFHREEINFEDDDPYVSCSKPACYCCYLYFIHHPLGPVVPATHQNIHRNWKPPSEDERFEQVQRNILLSMTQDVRRELLRLLDSQRMQYGWRPDSTTGITVSHRSSNDPDFEPDDLTDRSDSGSDAGDLFDDVDSVSSETSVQSSSQSNRGDTALDSITTQLATLDWRSESPDGGVRLS